MGGLRKAMPKTLPGVPDRLACARRDPAVRGLLLQGLDPRRRPRERRRYGVILLVVRPARRAPDRHLHLPAALRRLPRRALSARPRAHRASHGGHGHGEGPRTMTVPVARARRARRRRRLDPVPRYLASASATGSTRRRRAARRADDDAGLRHERPRGRARPAGIGSPGSSTWPAGARCHGAVAARGIARAQALLRRALRRDLLPARRLARWRPAALRSRSR